MMFAAEIDKAIETLIAETRDSGGSTVSVTGANLPDSGYMVGGMVDGVMTAAEMLSPEHHDDLVYAITNYISKHFDLLTQRNIFLGGWVDAQEDTLWIDISERFNVKEYALLTAEDRGEIAIWDVAESEEIRVKE